MGCGASSDLPLTPHVGFMTEPRYSNEPEEHVSHVSREKSLKKSAQQKQRLEMKNWREEAVEREQQKRERQKMQMASDIRQLESKEKERRQLAKSIHLDDRTTDVAARNHSSSSSGGGGGSESQRRAEKAERRARRRRERAAAGLAVQVPRYESRKMSQLSPAEFSPQKTPLQIHSMGDLKGMNVSAPTPRTPLGGVDPNSPRTRKREERAKRHAKKGQRARETQPATKLRKRADKNALGRDGVYLSPKTPPSAKGKLMVCSMRDLRGLDAAGAAKNARDDADTALPLMKRQLFKAVMDENPEMIEKLLPRDPRLIRARNAQGETALELARDRGKWRATNVLEAATKKLEDQDSFKSSGRHVRRKAIIDLEPSTTEWRGRLG